MSISINGLNIADTRIQGVSILPVLGAYELVFALDMKVHTESNFACRASIIGARVTIKTTGAQNHAGGFARPHSPINIQQRSFQSNSTPVLYLPLQPGQLGTIEQLRGTGDLDFELSATGIGIDQHGEQQVMGDWRIHVPRSDWIKKLRDSKARDVLLLEVPLPLGTKSKKWADVAKNLERAEEHFRNGDYHACVGSCRLTVQELGHQKFKKKDWAGQSLKRLAGDRNNMSKGEREAALWGALRHYTHQAHHSGNDGGVSVYTRAEARLVLTLAASFVAHEKGE